MAYKTEITDNFYTEFYAYLQTHGQHLSAYRWLACEATIGTEAALLDGNRQTLEQAEKTMHFYLNLLGI